jgi:exodeoxyribonuclease (lambda-induced)
MNTIECEQGTPEWFKARSGHLTASHAQEIGNGEGKDGKLGKGLETYIYKLLAEEYSSGEVEYYSNKDMDRGTELEPLARGAYEMDTGSKVEQVGFMELNEFVGCSPDGLVDKEGMVEIKCHDDVKHFRLLVNGEKEIESKYIWQIQMQMWVAGRKWCDYVAYNPNYTRSLYIKRITLDNEKCNLIAKGVEVGIKRIKELKKLV